MRTKLALIVLLTILLTACGGQGSPTALPDLYDKVTLDVPGKNYSVTVEPVTEDVVDPQRTDVAFYAVAYGGETSGTTTAIVVYRVTTDGFYADIVLKDTRYFRVFQTGITGGTINPIITDAKQIMNRLCLEAAEVKDLQALCY